MNGQPLDNSISSELDKVITWQYDNATNLIAIVDMMKEFFTESTTKFWDNWPVDVVNIDTANDFGLCVWGKLLNVPWLETYTVIPDQMVSDDGGLVLTKRYTPTGIMSRDANFIYGGDLMAVNIIPDPENYFCYRDETHCLMPAKSSYTGIYALTYAITTGNTTQDMDDVVCTGYFESTVSNSMKVSSWFDPSDPITITPIRDDCPIYTFRKVPSKKISTGKISSELYRKILKARVKLLSSNATIPDYCEFINTVFDGKVKVIDGLDMSLKFKDNGLDGEQKSVFDNHMDVIIAYPSGVRDNNKSNSPIFALDGQQKVASTDQITGGLDESSFIYK